jgi:hypothetical protein
MQIKWDFPVSPFRMPAAGARATMDCHSGLLESLQGTGGRVRHRSRSAFASMTGTG